MKTILYLNREMGPLRVAKSNILGGPEFVIDQQLKALSKDHKILFWCTADSDDLDMPNVTQIKSENPSKYFFRKEGKRCPTSWVKNFRKEIAEIMENNHVDMIFSQMFEVYGFDIMMPYADKIPCVHHEHCFKEDRFGISSLRYFSKANEFAQKGGHYWTVGTWNQNDFNKYCKKRWDYDNPVNGVLPAFIAQDDWFMPEIRNTVVAATRLDPRKNFELLFQAAPIMKELGLKYIIYGAVQKESKFYETYLKALERWPIDDGNCELRLNRPRPEVLDALGTARVIFQSSNGGATDLVYTEAFNFGVPVVGLTKPDMNHVYDDFIPKFDQHVVEKLYFKRKMEPDRINMIRTGMQNMLAQPYDLDIKRAIHERTKEIWSEENVLSELRALLK